MGAHLYGCDVAEAREIVPLRPLTRLPGAPPFVRGLMNMRGTIVTVIDLGARIEPARGLTQQGSILLVRSRDRVVGLVVDHVAEVRALEAASDSRAVVPGRAGTGGIVKGMATMDDTTVVMLDLEALIDQVLQS